MTNEEKIKKLKELVNQQAEDVGLWFVAKPRFSTIHGWVDDPITIGEAYLQQELRKLHVIIEELE